MNGGATRLNGYLTAHHFGYNPETPAYPHDPEEARRLLAEAGYGQGLTLVFDFPSTMPDEAPALTRMMVEQYKQVGIIISGTVSDAETAPTRWGTSPGYACLGGL